MRQLVILSVTSSAIWCILIVLLKPAGAFLHPSPTMLRELAECNYQCWNGIAAGQTSINEAETMMGEMGYRRVDSHPLLGGGLAAVFTFGECDIVIYYSQWVESIHFPSCSEIALGDVILMLGAPDAVIYRNSLDYELRWRRYRGLFVHVENWSSPHNQPLRITLSTPIDFSTESKQGRWRGFIALAPYCAMEQPTSFFGC